MPIPTRIIPPLSPQDIKRFWSKVDKRGPDECWPWKGLNRAKHRGFCMLNTCFGAHRVAFSISTGPIPENKFVCHHCDNPPCCNPNHLFLGTAKDNTEDMLKKKRHRTTCGVLHYKHKLTDEIVVKAHQMYSTGNHRWIDIGRILGFNGPLLREACCETWKHLKLTSQKGKRVKPILVAAKLSESQVLEIRRLYESRRYRLADLGKMFNVRETNICSIVNRKTWKHI